MSLYLKTAFSFLCAFFIVRAAIGEELAGDTANIKADKLEVKYDEHLAHFYGHVVVNWKDISLQCDELTVSYGEDSQISGLRAVGKVAVIFRDARAEAWSAELDARQGLLLLKGNPVLTEGPQRLTGKQIAVYLASGRMEVLEARAVLRWNKKVEK